MKTITILSLTLILFLSCKSNSDENKKITAVEIWENYLANCGDREKIYSIKTYYAEIISESSIGMIKTIVKNKYPDKMYLETTYPNDVVETFIINGNNGIIKSPKGIEKISQKEIEKNYKEEMLIPEFEYIKKGYKIELTGEEKINGSECYKLKILKESGEMYYFIEKETFILLRTENDGNIIEALETEKVNGILLTKKMTITRNQITLTGTYLKQKFDIEINDSVFNIENQ